MAANPATNNDSVISFPGFQDQTLLAAASSIARDNRGGGRTCLRRWTARMAFRRSLRRLLDASPHLVRDIGLDEGLVRREVTLPFWKGGQLRPEGIRLPLV